MTDLEIAKSAKLMPVCDIANNLGILQDNIESYGKYKAKIEVEKNLRAKLVLVTAINPTAAGEGKTTISIGLADGLKKINKSVCLALREPSLGPVFGVKGGAAGGGYAQVVPMEDINLHFTGDMHAITAANNLLSAMIDNHIFQGNALKIDDKNIFFSRCLDSNDRALRNATVGAFKDYSGRQDKFVITAASEVMAILCLAKNLEDLKQKLGNISIGLDTSGQIVYAHQLNAQGAMAALLKDAIKPNLVQTLENTPAIIHGGPFANIAHGCNSIIATYAAMSVADYAITEAGFGADLGAEKFIDLKCRLANIEPSAVVIVATIKALKLHGGAQKAQLFEENAKALELGLENLKKHIQNIKNVFNKPAIVAINKFSTDTQQEIEMVKGYCANLNTLAVECQAFAQGGQGAIELAQEVEKLCQNTKKLNFTYKLDQSIEEKLQAICQKIYGGDGVDYSGAAKEKIEIFNKQGFSNLPIIVAKTQYSLSDNPKLFAAPTGFRLYVNDLILKSGAGFIVAVCGSVNLMPGLPLKPAAQNIDIDGDGVITGLF